MTLETALIILFVALIVGVVGYQTWWHLKYRKEYSLVKFDKGVVTDMKYTPSRTSTTYNGKSTTTSTTPAKHYVYIKFSNMGENSYNNVRLYETVRLDDDVTAEYVEVWRVEKTNPNNRTFMRYEVKTITSPKGRTVQL